MTPEEMSKCHIETSGHSITATFIMKQFQIEPGTVLKGIVTHYQIDSNGYYVSFLHPSQDPKHDLLLLLSHVNTNLFLDKLILDKLCWDDIPEYLIAVGDSDLFIESSSEGMTSEATMSGVISERALRLEGRQAQGSERGIQRELVQGGEISHGVVGDVDCVNKSLQHVEQTRGKWVGTSHIEVVVVPCGQVLSVIENAENSKGASWNMLQHSLLMATKSISLIHRRCLLNDRLAPLLRYMLRRISSS